MAEDRSSLRPSASQPASAQSRTLEGGESPAEAAPIISEPVEFWFVWTKWGHAPRHFHHSEERAVGEAMRLARAHPDRKFIVLQATHKFSAIAGAVIPLAEAIHASDCATNNAPALPVGPCDCGAANSTTGA